MFNFTLLFDRFGRHVLTRRERTGAFIFGASFLLVLGALAWWISGGRGGRMMTLIFAYVSAFVASSVNASGRRAVIMGIATGALALLGIGSLVLVFTGNIEGVSLFGYFLLGSIVFALATLFIKDR